MSKISIYDLMTICRVLLLIIGQNHINPKLLQPIVESTCKVMTVKKPCVQLDIDVFSKIFTLVFVFHYSVRFYHAQLCSILQGLVQPTSYMWLDH